MATPSVRNALIFFVRLYQSAGFFWKPRCRYWPTCSEYSREALERHGAWCGLLLTVRRLARCRPWGGHGYDPVPQMTKVSP
ncbi:MAG: membrane protein insertion efficiency factor YidD [bacterium]|nr:membrane protein insertion efficiency factor YidD [bacterium]